MRDRRTSPGVFLSFLCCSILLFPLNLLGQHFAMLSRARTNAAITEINLEPMQREAALRFPDLSTEQLRALTLDSFESVYFGKVDRTRLLVEPGPDFIAGEIADLLVAFRGLKETLQQGTNVIIAKGPLPKQLEVVHAVRDQAEAIHTIFDDYFLETHTSSLTVALPLTDRNLDQFSLFLHEVRSLVQSLSEEIDNYYFDCRPGLVNVSDYHHRYSISVLTELLIDISHTIEKRS